MVRTSSRFTMTDDEREDQKKTIKEKLKREKSKSEDADSKLGEPYVTDNKTEIEMLTEECRQEMLPINTGREVKLDEIATSTERLSIPHMNSAGQLKLQSNRFMENFEPDPTASAIRPWEIIQTHHPILAIILLLVGTEDTRLPGEAYIINQEFLSRGDNLGRYMGHVDLSLVEFSWNGNDLFSDTRVLILSDSGNLVDMPEVMLLRDVTS